MKIGYLGPAGTYTEAATEKLLAQLKLPKLEPTPVDGITPLLDQLSLGTFDAAVVPLRNTLAGDYRETVAGIAQHRLVAADETILKIELAVGIHPASSVDQITEIWSKDTALRECSQYLASRFPSARLVEVPSTGFAMKEIAEKNLLHVAAVGSEMGLRRYGLTRIAQGVENPGENVTTFLLLKRSE